MSRGVILVVPIKATLGAKQRLAARLSPEERRLLALAMAGDALRTVAAVVARRRTLVVGGDADVAALARRCGVGFVSERGAGQSAALRVGVAWAVEHGATGLATMAADCPLATPDDIEMLMAAAGRPGRHLSCAPDAEGTGTNAVALRPLDVDPWRFGPDSLRRHREAAADLELRFQVLQLPSLLIDCDRPSDLAGVLQEPRPTATFHMLRQLGLARRTAAAGH